MRKNKLSFVLVLVFSLFILSSVSFATDLLIARSETYEELLLFFEEKDLLMSATGTLKPKRLAPAIANVITAEEIRKMGAASLDEVLETIPGVHVGVSQMKSMSSLYSIRGIRTEMNPQVLILINNIPLKALASGALPYTFRLPLSMISKIEVVRGPGSAVYGADAFAGVINIFTKTAADIEGTASGVRAGSFNTYDVWLQHGGNYLGWDVALGIEAQKSQGDPNRIIDQDRQSLLDNIPALGTEASLAPGTINTGYDVIDTHLWLQKNNWQLSLWKWMQKDAGLADQAMHIVSPESKMNIDLFQAKLTYGSDTKDHSDWSYKIDMNYTYILMDHYIMLFPPGSRLPIGQDGNIDFTALPNTTLFTHGMLGNPIWIDRHYGINATTIYNGLDSHNIRLATGYTYLSEQIKQYKNNGPGVLNYTDEDPYPEIAGPDLIDVSGTQYVFLPDKYRKLWFLSFQDEWAIFPKWEITAGMRYDKYSDFGDTVNPRFAVVWDTNESITTKLLYGRAFSPPSFAELYTQNNPQAVGNPNLDAETIETIELAFDYKPNDDFHSILNIFMYDIKDLIEFVPDPAPLITSTAQNSQDRIGNGFELEVNWNINKAFSIYSNLAYQNSRDKKTNLVIPNTPGLQFYFNPNWNISQDWSLSAKYYWITDIKRPEGDTRSDIMNYTLTALNLKYKKPDLNWGISFGINNLFDNDVREPNVDEVPNDYPMEGRSFFFEINYN